MMIKRLPDAQDSAAHDHKSPYQDGFSPTNSWDWFFRSKFPHQGRLKLETILFRQDLANELPQILEAPTVDIGAVGSKGLNLAPLSSGLPSFKRDSACAHLAYRWQVPIIDGSANARI
jgi:hypothetical protein